MRKSPYNSAFPVYGMIHLKGETKKETLARAINEAEIYMTHGVSAIIVENYYGKPEDVKTALTYFHSHKSFFRYGVNLLRDFRLGFQLARQFEADFIQIDSVAGHLSPDQDKFFENILLEERKSYNGMVFGGVRFKYQPYLSGRSLEEDLTLGCTRSDAIVVTGTKTGEPTPLKKINEFRRIVNEFPLIIGAGLNPENCEAVIPLSDGAIVGSYFKENHKDSGEVKSENVAYLMSRVKAFTDKLL